MKKLTSVLVAIALFAALLVPAAFAAGATEVVATEVTSAVPGDEVTIEVSITNNPGFDSAKFTLAYDKSALVLKELTPGLLNGFSNVETAQINHASANDVTEDGILFTATFEVTGSAKADTTYPVDVVVNKLNNEGVPVDHEVTDGSITTAPCEHKDEDKNCICDSCGGALPHVDDDHDCVCDVCGTELDHDHVDKNKDCACDLCGTALDHVDANGDHKCDVCKKVLPHDHEDADGKWNTSSSKHWHECSCGEKFDEERHSWVNRKCEICGKRKSSGGAGGVGSDPVSEMNFSDVDSGAWFYSDVKYVYEKGLMNGTGDGGFSPGMEMSRAMLVTVLYRMDSEPYATYRDVFPDVADGTWYTSAVIWATDNKVVKGYDNGLFGTEDSVTREQIAVFLYRYAQYRFRDVSARGDLSAFVDGGSTSVWAREAMEWAVGAGLINGKDGGRLDPTGVASRSEVAALLHRFCENFWIL